MNKRWIVICFAIVALFGLGWLFGQSFSQKAEAIQPGSAPTQIPGVDIELLQKRWGRVFVPADAATRASVKVTSEQALQIAYSSDPDLKNATQVVSSLGHLSDPGMIQAAQNGDNVDMRVADSGLVWILSFEGIQSVSHGPPGVKHAVSNELNVVVSAITGEELYQLVYR